MGLFFRKSIRLGKGFRLNVSKRGFGISAGVRGLRISAGPHGTFLSGSIPGTGIGFGEKLDKRRRPTRQRTDKTREAPQWQPEPQLRQRQQVPVGRRVIGLASVGTAFIFFVRMFGLPAGPALPNGNLAAPVIQAAPQREPIHHAPAGAISAPKPRILFGWPVVTVRFADGREGSHARFR